MCINVNHLFRSYLLGASPLYLFGTEKQKNEFLVPLCRGEALGAFGLTEPHAGSDAGGTQTKATLTDNHWIIKGSKSFIFITNASLAKAVLITGVRGNKNGEKEISGIIVPTHSPGYEMQEPYDKMGLNSSNTTALFFDHVEVPLENLLGTRSEGFKQFLITLDGGGRIGIGAMGVRIAQGALDKSLKYAKQRFQFGQAISSFQITQFKLSDMAMKIELARNMVYKAALLKDQGRSFTKEASMCKLFATEICMEVCREAIQIHRGNGYVRDYHVERYLRDAKF